MRFFIDDLPVIFPYPYAYPEQVAMMNDLKRTLDANGKAVIESPSGTGKTVSLLSLIVSYQLHYPAARKLIYCTRTVPEIEKVLAELKRLMEYRARYNPADDEMKDGDGEEVPLPLPKGQGQHEDILALGLSSRKNLCIHPSVSRERRGNVVDARCRDMTSAWACEKGRQDPGSVELCDFHENLGKLEPGHLLPHGVWTLEDVKVRRRDSDSDDAALRGAHPACSSLSSRTPGLLARSRHLPILRNPSHAALRQHCRLLLPLLAGPKGRRAGIKGDVKGRHRRL